MSILFANYDRNAGQATVSVRRRAFAYAALPGALTNTGVARMVTRRVVTAAGSTEISGTVAMIRPRRRVQSFAGSATDPTAGAAFARIPGREVACVGSTEFDGVAQLARPNVRAYANGLPAGVDLGSSTENLGVVQLRRPLVTTVAFNVPTPARPGTVWAHVPLRLATAAGYTIAGGTARAAMGRRVYAIGLPANVEPGSSSENPGNALLSRPHVVVGAKAYPTGLITGSMIPDYPLFMGVLGQGVPGQGGQGGQGGQVATASVTESLIVRAILSANWIQTMREGLRLDGQPLPLLEALASCSDGFGFGSMVSIAYRMLMRESASFAASPIGSMTFALQVADALAMVGGVGSQLDAQVAVAAALVLGDSHANVYPLTLDAGLDMSASAEATLRAVLKVLDALRMQAAATPGVTWLVQHAENVELGAGLSASAELNAAIREGLGILGEINLPDGAYLAWVVNTETRAFVKYRNFPFNSFARIGNSYFGASADGIYRLGGDSDAGEPIAATVRGALSDYGGSRMKRMPACYVGYRTDDVMLLKVAVTNKDGDREEHVYRMESRPAKAMRVNRVKLGRGLKSTYWGWELTNIDGADFALDSFRWYPVVLERRL